MIEGARTPEELDSLFEDAFVMRDRDALCALFADGAVLVTAAAGQAARGHDAIRDAVTDLVGLRHTYVAGPTRILQAGDLALVLGDAGVHVARRGRERRWLSAISVIEVEGHNRQEAT